MPSDDNRPNEDSELEDDGPVETLDDDDIAVLKSYVCRKDSSSHNYLFFFTPSDYFLTTHLDAFVCLRVCLCAFGGWLML